MEHWKKKDQEITDIIVSQLMDDPSLLTNIETYSKERQGHMMTILNNILQLHVVTFMSPYAHTIASAFELVKNSDQQAPSGDWSVV